MKQFQKIFTTVTLVLAFLMVTNVNLNAQGTWVQKANFTGTAREYAASFSIGTNGYIGTGWDGANDYNDFWQWNSATNSWTQKANFGGIAREEAVGFAIGGKGYIGTGWDDVNEVALGDLWEYDTLTNTWAEKASLPVNYERESAVGFSIGTKGYIGTGAVQGYIDSKDLWEWDQATNTWAQKADMPTTNGRTNGIGFSIGTMGYIGTGFFFNTNDNSTTYFNDFYQWNQSNNTWTARANIGAGVRIDAVSFSIGNYGYICTGYDNTQQNHNDSWAYNSINNTWAQQANVGTTLRWAGTGFSIGNKGYVGVGYSTTYLNDFWEFTPPCNSVSVTVTANGPATFNYPGSVTLDAGAFTSYLWSNLSTSESIIANISGNYSVTVTDVNGCTGVGSQAVTATIDTLNTPVLYGVTYEGGPHGYGNLFHYITATNTVVIDTSYGGTGTDPYLPVGSLFEASNGKIYGMTSAGGSLGYGTLFEFAPATHTYLTKFNFDGAANGAGPTGALMQASNGKLYGMTSSSGSNNCGIIFRYNPATSQLTVVSNFDGTNTGKYPHGDLIQANNGKLYGLTNSGGAHNYGTLFQFDPVSNVITKIIDFDSTVYGMNPAGSLKQASNGKLYGMTYGGGSSHYFGTLFEFNPATNAMVVDVNFGHINNSFANDNGESPEGSVIQANTGLMYGMTTYGNLGYGTLFVFNDSTNILTSLVNFDGYHEKNPMGSLMQASNGKLYGMAYLGGSGADGALFDFNPSTNVLTTDINFTGQNGEFPEGSALIEYITTCTSYTPSITANGPTTFCNGSSVILDGGTYSSYLWSTGATTEHLSVTASGTYSLTVTNASGCTGTASQVVTVNPNLTPVITLDSGNCGSITLITGTSNSYNWSTGATTQSILATSSGAYSVTVTDGNSCTGTASQNVTVNSIPAPVIIPSGPTTFNAPGSVNLDAGSYTSYSWSNGSTTESITVSTSGTYTITVTDVNGCTGVAAQSVVSIINCPGTAYIANFDTVFVINVATTTIIATIPLSGALSVSVSPDGSKVYVSGTDTVYVINTTTNTVTAVIPVNHVFGLAVSPDGSKVYANGTNIVYVINTATNTVTAVIPVSGVGIAGLAFNPDGSKVYVANYGDNTVNVINTTTNTVSDTILLAGFGAPEGICVTPDGSKVYVADYNTVSVINTATNTVSDTLLSTINGDAGGVCVSPDGTKLYVVEANGPYTGVIVINTDYDTIMASIFGMQGDMFGISITPDGSKVYVESEGGYFAYVINTATNTISDTINILSAYGPPGAFGNFISTYCSTPCIPPVLVITSNGNTTFCQGDSVTLDAGTWSSYSWSDGSTNETLTATTTGNYTVTVTDVNGCTGTASQNVIVNPNPVALFTADTLSGCNILTVDFTNLSTGATSFEWFFGDGNHSFILHPAHTYGIGIYNVMLIASSTNGCNDTNTIANYITVSNPTPSITSNGNTTFCQGGSVTLDAGSYYSYSWSDGSTNETLVATTSGTYTVTVTDVNGCTGTASQAITVNPSPTPTIIANGPTDFCQGGSVSLDAGSYTSYHWSDGATNESVTISVTGNYRVTVTDGNGCTGTASQLVNVFNNPTPSITANGPTTFCEGGSVTLDAGLDSSYMWSDGNISESDIITFSGDYSVTVTDGNGCTGTTSQGVTVIPSPSPVITSNGSTNFCQGGSVTLDAGSWSSYSWSDNNTTETDVISTNGTYSVTVTDSIGCTGMASQVVTVNPNPSPSIIPNGPTTFNQGGNVILDAGVYSSFIWSTGATDESIDVTTSGTYSVTVTDANGCTGMNSILVTVNPLTCSIIPNGSTTFCEGGSVVLDAGIGASYIWSDGSTNETLTASASGTYTVTITDSLSATCVAFIDVTVNQNPVPTITGPSSICDGSSATLDAGSWASYLWSTTDMTETITVNTSDTYSVTVSDNNGCTGMASQFLMVNANPLPSIFAQGNTTFCDGGSVTLDASSWAMYQWSNSGTDETITANSTGTYMVTITDFEGCTGMASQDVIVNQNPVPAIIPNGATTFCDGGNVTLNAGIWTGYLWSTGDNSESITANSTGTYSVTVTDGNGCMGMTSQDVTVNQNPSPSIIPSGSTTFCEGGSVTLDGGSWASYNWSTGDSSESITVNSTGTYNVTITDGNGCTGMTSQDVTVNQNPSPSITPSGSTTFCNGGSVSLDAGSWAAYDWSTGASSESITASSSGTYSVTITDGNGCNGMSSQTVTVNQNPSPSITPSGATTFCDGGSVSLDAGTWSSYNWSNGASSESISVSTSGTYMVTIVDGNGCMGMASQGVTVNSNPSPAILPNGNTTFCSGGSVMLDAGSWSSYNWSTGANTETITASANGNYSVTVSNNNGCSGNTSIMITVNSLPSPTISANGPTSFCDGSSVGLDAGSYSSYLWNTGETTESITVFGSQPYCVTVTDANGCTNSNCIFINVFAVPIASITGPSFICNGNSATLNAGAAISYIWSNGSTTQSTSVNTSGNYCVTVSNSLGCTASTCHSFTVSSAIIPTIAANGPTTFCQSSNVTLDAGSGYSLYIWSNGASTETITVNTSNVYKVTVSNATGCTGSASQTVTVTPLITGLSIVGPTSACGGGNVTLTTSSAYGSYIWSNGATTHAINIAATGIYYVTVSNGGNCTATAHQSVTILTSPVPNIFPDSLSNLCSGGNATLKVGATFHSYLWNTGATSQLITINTGGTYSVTVTSTNGCTGASSMATTSGCSIPVIAAIPTTNIVATGGMANWIQPACYYNYTIRISLHNANSWTSYTFLPNSHYMFSNLLHNTAYDWQIQTNCNASGTINSGFSATQTFTTLARLTDGETGNPEYAFNVYPNPTNDRVTVAFTTGNEDVYSIRMMDVTGRIVLSQNYTSVVGENQYQLNLSTVAKGVYTVILQNGTTLLQSKIVVQ